MSERLVTSIKDPVTMKRVGLNSKALGIGHLSKNIGSLNWVGVGRLLENVSYTNSRKSRNVRQPVMD